jgi:hypothetical protein
MLVCGCVTRPRYKLQESIRSANKNSVFWAEAFLIEKGMEPSARVDFEKTKQEEQPKLDAMMRFWKSLPDKDEVDQEFDRFLMIQSPLHLGRW